MSSVQPIVSIREMQHGDAVAMHVLFDKAVRETCAPFYSREEVEAWLRGRSPEGYVKAAECGENFFIASAGEQVVGFSSWCGNELVALFVDPEFQGRGVGRLLYAACFDAARQAGKSICYLKSSMNGRTYYQAMGYRLAGIAFKLKEGVFIPHFEMRL